MKLNQVKGIVGDVAAKAKTATRGTAKKIQQRIETPEKLTRSMDAMDASRRALVYRSKKAAVPASKTVKTTAATTGNITISKTAAETAKKTPDEKLMDLVTGTKANKSAQESTELMNADAAYKAAIGPQADKSAVDSASTFIIEGNTEKGKALKKALTEQERKAAYLKDNPEFADKLAQKQQDAANAAKIQATKARLQEKYGK